MANSVRRLISMLSVVAATGGVVLAQPAGKAPAGKAPAPTPAPAPAAGAPAPATPATPAAATPAEGSAVAPIEDAPPSDMEGRDENPDAPHGTDEEVVATPGPAMVKASVYPIEDARRPITLPENMAEVSMGPHFRISPYSGGDALRARYGIRPMVQL